MRHGDNYLAVAEGKKPGRPNVMDDVKPSSRNNNLNIEAQTSRDWKHLWRQFHVFTERSF